MRYVLSRSVFLSFRYLNELNLSLRRICGYLVRSIECGIFVDAVCHILSVSNDEFCGASDNPMEELKKGGVHPKRRAKAVAEVMKSELTAKVEFWTDREICKFRRRNESLISLTLQNLRAAWGRGKLIVQIRRAAGTVCRFPPRGSGNRKGKGALHSGTAHQLIILIEYP